MTLQIGLQYCKIETNVTIKNKKTRMINNNHCNIELNWLYFPIVCK